MEKYLLPAIEMIDFASSTSRQLPKIVCSLLLGFEGSSVVCPSVVASPDSADALESLLQAEKSALPIKIANNTFLNFMILNFGCESR